MSDGLKLSAQDKEDLTIISAYLQDAVTVVADFTFQPSDRIFVLMLNRYLWEGHKACSDDNGNKRCMRIRTGCHFKNVLKVTAQNIAQKNKKHILELLTIETSILENGNTAIDLIFSGTEVIRLEAELIEAQMQDIGTPYPAACHPKHEVLEALKEE